MDRGMRFMYLFVTSGTQAPEPAGCIASGSKWRCCLLFNKCQIRCLFGLHKVWTKTGKRGSQTSWHTHSEWIRWPVPEEQEKAHKKGRKRQGRTTCGWLQANRRICLFYQRWFPFYSSASVTLSKLCYMLERTPKGLWGSHLVLVYWERSNPTGTGPKGPPCRLNSEASLSTLCIQGQTALQEPLTLTRLEDWREKRQ